jgi:hypothetical protein
MTDLSDAGQEQLFTAECSGLRSAWRRAAELSAQTARVQTFDARPPAGRHIARSLLGAVVATFVLGLYTMPFNVHARHSCELDNGVDSTSAPDGSGD